MDIHLAHGFHCRKRKERVCDTAPAHETTFEEVAAAFKDDDVKNLVAPDCDTSAANAGHFIELSLRSLKAIKDLLDGETYDLSDMPAQDVEKIKELVARFPDAVHDAKRVKVNPPP